jgi:hypothetical protein
MIEHLGTVVAATACLVFLLVSGITVAFLVGRGGPGGRGGINHETREESHLPRRLVRELERCLELGECVMRDGHYLAAVIEQESKTVPMSIGGAAKQLIKTTKSLALRLKRVGAEAHMEVPSLAVQNTAQCIERNTSGLPQQQPVAIPCFSAEAEATPKSSQSVNPPDSPAEVRQFPRSSFQGTAEATIFPQRAGSGRDPVHCTVLTRDLSRSGISVAHSEQLFPKQIVVLETVGKLLVGQVRWCRFAEENFYVAGCQLLGTSACRTDE